MDDIKVTYGFLDSVAELISEYVYMGDPDDHVGRRGQKILKEIDKLLDKACEPKKS